jgi:hypothetical protein
MSMAMAKVFVTSRGRGTAQQEAWGKQQRTLQVMVWAT